MVDVADYKHEKDGMNAVFQPVKTDFSSNSPGEIQAKMSQNLQDLMTGEGDMCVTLEFRHSAEWFTEWLLREQAMIKCKKAQEACIKVRMVQMKAISEFEKFQDYRHPFRHAKESAYPPCESSRNVLWRRA